MTPLTLFLPCAAGVEGYLADEVHGLTGLAGDDLLTVRGGVRVRGDWALVMRLNLHSRLAQRVLIELAHGPYGDEHDLYALAASVAWEDWFSPRQTFRVDVTAQASPLKSLNFATLRVKDAVADRFRERAGGVRPSIDTRAPDVRVQAHLGPAEATLYIDTSGEPLFKRGWRQDKGDAPLKETLAAAMLAASGWWQPAERRVSDLPLYDPCCGSGTIVIEAAQLRLGLPAGGQRRFAFERLKPLDPARWNAIKTEAARAYRTGATGQFDSKDATIHVFGSDVAHRMVDFAQRNAERAGVAHAVQLRGGDALQRMPPTVRPGVLLMNPPYGERIAAAGVAGVRAGGREAFQSGPLGRARDAAPDDANAGDEFFARLAAHWKGHYAGWAAWLLTPDLKLPGRLRLKESRRVPLWNGPIECRLFRFDLTARQRGDSEPKTPPSA
ncbi:THUMP domain-containing class I SAM-dependent RNA methyltransferase [Ottowia testudinis]|uniref:Class I SAM-dependent RNA methyltransferase n=1 Tax=Ottowia testudinis TaxID=2816950 RepID=A0A975CIR9_9BURK|nr:THUMP domain-containing protein [Ottowia testudinis]QTD45851.1 class I SAM-dependent RNA methyltransferase [Ottowia testudinis]